MKPEGGEGLLLGLKSRQAPLSVRHRHRADLQLRCGGPEGEALEGGEPQGRGLGGIIAVRLEDPHRPGGADAMAVVACSITSNTSAPKASTSLLA
jgi:hypothetical protein